MATPSATGRDRKGYRAAALDSWDPR